MTKTDSILVLSYNICYQSMTNSNRGTAAYLGDSCTWIDKGELTICAQNMANFMDGAPATVGHANFDFVGLQEANKVKFLQMAAKNSLAKLTMIHSRSHASNHGHAMQMASFYDASKYSLVDSVCSQFDSRTTDRPFHLLLFTDNASGDEIIFINVHSPHGGEINTRQNKNTNPPQQFPKCYYRTFDAVSYDLSAAAKTLKTFDSSKNYKIIMTGDFNETGWDFGAKKLTQMKWQPLSYAGITIDVEISNIVFSCSKADGCWHTANGERGGDYVFASGFPATIVVPSNYVFAPSEKCKDVETMKSIWQSDHLPVMAELS